MCVQLSRSSRLALPPLVVALSVFFSSRKVLWFWGVLKDSAEGQCLFLNNLFGFVPFVFATVEPTVQLIGSHRIHCWSSSADSLRLTLIYVMRISIWMNSLSFSLPPVNVLLGLTRLQLLYSLTTIQSCYSSLFFLYLMRKRTFLNCKLYVVWCDAILGKNGLWKTWILVTAPVFKGHRQVSNFSAESSR